MPDPTRIRRRDLLAALDLLGITSTNEIAAITIDPAAITVTRYLHGIGGFVTSKQIGDVVTTTTRIEIR